MPETQVPSVFVSSTCFDLSQVRADLERSIADLGLDPVVSESDAFPVNPNATVVENCLRVVKDRSDIFVLIVGGRYGSLTDSGHSVTNLEYLEAKAKGIPIYVFVSKSVLQVIPVWKKNPDGDFSDVVDTPRLFHFVETLRDSKEHWVFPFEEAADIERTLRKQLPYLFMDSLLVRHRVRDLNLPASLGNLSGRSLRLLMEKPTVWEHFFFASILQEEIEKSAPLKWDLEYSIKTGATRSFSTADIKQDLVSTNDWLIQKLANVVSLVDSVASLMNVAAQKALNATDPEHLAYVASRLALMYKRLLEWTIDFNEVDARPGFSKIISLIAAFSSDAIAQLEGLPERIRTEFTKAIKARDRGEQYVANVMLVLQAPSTAELGKEFEILEAQILRKEI